MYNNFSSKKTKKVISALLASALVVTSAPITANAATKKVVGVGKTVTYKAGATVKKITVKNKKVVKATKSKKNKKYVTLKGLKAGKTTVTIKTSKKTIKLNVCVGATKITKKTLKTTMTAGGKQTVSVTAAGGKGDTIKFASSNKAVLKVNKTSAKASAKGIAKMDVAAVAEGTAKLTVSSKNTGVKKSFTIKVTAATPAPATQPPTVATTPAVTGTATAVATTPAVQATATAAVPGATDTAATPGTDVTATPGTDVTQNPDATPGADVTATPGTDATVAPTFDPVTAKEGTLTVTTNVSGASIKVISGGATVASVSMNPLENSVTTATLQPGVYTVEITKKGYDKKTETVTIDGNKTLDVTLAEEVVLGASAAVTNSLVEYDNTVLVNQNAIVTVTVKDKDGNLVPGKTVVLSVNTADGSKSFEVKGQNVQTTDANGQASFVVGFDGAAPTESTNQNFVGSAQFTAQVLNVTDGTNPTATGCVGFAALDLGTVTLDDDSNEDLVLGANAVTAGYDDEDGLADTHSINGNNTVEYVSTQQVSTTGTNENALTFDVAPQIVLPKMSTQSAETREFVKPISEKDGVSGKYSTYATTEYDHVVYLDEDTSNLEYATLIFSDVQLSEYTKMVITAYKTSNPKYFDDSDYIVDTYTVKGEHEQKNFGYQIPVNADVKAIKVSLKSAGQIETDKNSGYKMTEIRGIYKSAISEDGGSKDISTASVSWETTSPTMSNLKELSPTNAVDLLGITPSDGGTSSTTECTFKYQVPTFPNTGDAVIIEYDTNSKIVAYYLAPTENEFTIADGVRTYNNRNEIKAIVEQANGLTVYDKYKAYKATEAEATTFIKDGITTKGNSVTVNSETVGSTNLKGTISLPSLGGDVLDDSNRYVYTSVHWNPIPDEEAAAVSNAYLALAGQNVTVYAQLIDKNGNPVSEANVDVKYSCSNQAGGTAHSFDTQTQISQLDDIAVVKNAKTDVNGRATLVLNSGTAAVLDDLTAKSDDYKVKLYIGDDVTSNADIYWVNADLEFQKDVNSDVVKRTNGDTQDADTSEAIVGTPWEYAVKTVGNTFVKTGDSEETYEKEFRYPGALEGYDIDIDGLKINTSFDDDNKGQYKVVGNGVVEGASTYKYTDTIINEIDETSVVDGIKFVATKGDTVETYSCVGEGAPNLNAKLNLNAKWKTEGTAVTMITPLGTSISEDSVTLYVRLTDASGKNPDSGKKVYFKANNGTLTGAGSVENGTEDGLAYDKTDSEGIAVVKLDRSTDATSTVVTASVKDADNVASTTVNWVAGAYNPGLVNAAMSDDNTKQIVLTCNNKVNATSVKAGMFTVRETTGDKKSYEVTDATVSGKYITLTLKTALPANEYEVSVGTVEEDGITYELADVYGKTLETKYSTIKFYSEAKGSYTLGNPSTPTSGTSDIVISNVKAPGTTVGNSTTVSAADAKAFADAYIKVVVDGMIMDLDATAGTNVAVAGWSGSQELKSGTFTVTIPTSTKETKVSVYVLGSSVSTKTVDEDTDGFDLEGYSISTTSNTNDTITFKFNQNIDDLTDGHLDEFITGTENTVASIETVPDGMGTDVAVKFDASIEEGSEITIPSNVLGYLDCGKNKKVTVKVDTTAPTVVGSSTVKVPKASSTVSENAVYKFKFSEALDATSRLDLSSKVTAALTTSSTSTLTAVWNTAGDELTITFTYGDTDLTVAALHSGAIAVSDIHGNSASIALADLQVQP